MTKFDEQMARQGQRCAWCQSIVPAALLTRDHLFPKVGGHRARFGADYVLACEGCNSARGALAIGSSRFQIWIRRVINGRDAGAVARQIRDRRTHNSKTHA